MSKPYIMSTSTEEHLKRVYIMNTNIIEAIKSTNGKFFKIECIALGTGKKFSKTVRFSKNVKLIVGKAIQVFDTASKKYVLIMLSSIRRIVTKKETFFDFYQINRQFGLEQVKMVSMLDQTVSI